MDIGHNIGRFSINYQGKLHRSGGNLACGLYLWRIVRYLQLNSKNLAYGKIKLASRSRTHRPILISHQREQLLAFSTVYQATWPMYVHLKHHWTTTSFHLVGPNRGLSYSMRLS